MIALDSIREYLFVLISFLFSLKNIKERFVK